MSYDALMHWQREEGALLAVNEGNDHRHRSQANGTSQRGPDRRGRRVSFHTGRYPGERSRLREVMAA
jgi:hypothetical protein